MKFPVHGIPPLPLSPEHIRLYVYMSSYSEHLFTQNEIFSTNTSGSVQRNFKYRQKKACNVYQLHFAYNMLASSLMCNSDPPLKLGTWHASVKTRCLQHNILNCPQLKGKDEILTTGPDQKIITSKYFALDADTVTNC